MKYKIIILILFVFIIASSLSMAGMKIIEEKELAGISGRSGLDIVIDLGASINDFRFSDTGYIEFGGIVIDDGAGGSASLGTMADPFLFDIVSQDPDSGLAANNGYWTWDSSWTLFGGWDYDWDWTPGSAIYSEAIGPYLALEFPDNPANIDPVTIKINTLNFNGRYIGSQVDTSATAADALTDLEISGFQLNYLNDSTQSHLYIAAGHYSNPQLTYNSNSGDYTDADYEGGINIDEDDGNYPGDPVPDTDGSHDMASTGHSELIPDHILNFGTVVEGIFIDLALQAKIDALMYVYNPYSGTPDSYLELTNVHLFGNFATPVDYSSNNAAAWPAMQGALSLGQFPNDPMTLSISAAGLMTIVLPVKGSIRVENVSFTYEGVSNDGAAANHPDVNVLGPVMVDLIDATGVSATGHARYIKIELPVDPAGGWLTHANTTIY